jgi:hypothetical protein
MNHAVQRTPGRNDGGTRFLRNLAYLVPGYRGYKEKDLRREEDARLRSRVIGHLGEIREILHQRVERLRELSLESAERHLDARHARVEGLIRAVRFAPYGFAGFFDAGEIREETLEMILEIDLLLFQDLDDATEMLRGAPFPPSTETVFGRYFGTIDHALDRIEHRLVARDKLLGSC